jgi:hypothetical protein
MKNFNSFAIVLITIFTLGSGARAQQTVFNVPTADVLNRGKAYFELDVSVKPNDQDALQKFSSFVPRFVVGVGSNVEVGLNVLGNIQPGADNTTLVGAVKWRFYQNEKNGWSAFTGCHLYIPVKNKSYDVGTYTYLAVAKTINKTRLTAGGYVASKNVFAPNAVRGGGQFGFEQTVTSKLNINADWFTGKNASGYLTTGAAYKLTKKLTGVAAYSFGNANLSKGNHYMYFELGYNFN